MLSMLSRMFSPNRFGASVKPPLLYVSFRLSRTVQFPVSNTPPTGTPDFHLGLIGNVRRLQDLMHGGQSRLHPLDIVRRYPCDRLYIQRYFKLWAEKRDREKLSLPQRRRGRRHKPTCKFETQKPKFETISNGQNQKVPNTLVSDSSN
jgi:hypothetical protein